MRKEVKTSLAMDKAVAETRTFHIQPRAEEKL